jgi:hypothetical protein
MKETTMKRTSAIVLTLAFALSGSMGCGAKSPQPDPGPKDPGQKTCRNPDLETCTTQPDPTSAPDAGVNPAP